MGIKKLFQQQSVRYGGYASVMTLVVIGGIIALNLLVGNFSSVQVDLTENRIFSLSEQSEQIAQSLDGEVTIYAVYRRGTERQQVLEILRRYENLSANIAVEVIDPDQNPTFSQQYAQEGEQIPNGSVVIVQGETSRVIPPNELMTSRRMRQGTSELFNVERRVTNALAFLQTGNVPVVYQLTGHSEYTLSDVGMLEAIERENYRVRSLNLVTEPSVPEDAAIVTVMGPQSDITEPEAEKLRTYLNNGGSAFFAVDFRVGEAPVLNSLMESFGFHFRRGVVVEGNQNNHVSGSPHFLVPNMLEHPTVDPIRTGQYFTILRAAQPVDTVEVRRRNLEITPLFRTSPSAYLKQALSDAEFTMQQQAGDPTGPFTLAVAVEDQMATPDEPGLRIVALGNSTMLLPIGNQGIPQGNVDFFRNSLAWLQNQNEVIAIGPTSRIQLSMRLTGALTRIYAGIVVLLIPLAIFATGIVVYLRRRHL